jgi:O-antigen/teichoic acid export membrane protein
MALMVLSKPIIGTIYGGKWLNASYFLILAVVINLFAIFGNLSNSSLLMAMGETKMLMKLNALALFIGIPLCFLLIPQFGIVGAIFVGIIAGMPSWFIGLYWTWKHYRVKADFQASAKILLSSAIAAGSTYLFLSFFNSADWIRLVAGLLLFLAMYLILTPLIGGVNQTDVNNLRAMFSGLGIISRLLEIPLLLVERALRMRARCFGVRVQ